MQHKYIILKNYVYFTSLLTITSLDAVSPTTSHANSAVRQLLFRLEPEFLNKFDVLEFCDVAEAGFCICPPGMRACKSKGHTRNAPWLRDPFGCLDLKKLEDFFNQDNKQDYILSLVFPLNVTSFQSIAKQLSRFLTNFSSKAGLYYFVLQWPFQTTEVNRTEEIHSILDGVKFNIQSNIYILFHPTTQPAVDLWEFYNVKEYYAFRRLEMGRFYEAMSSKLPRRQNLQNQNIKALFATSGEYPFEISFDIQQNPKGEKTFKLTNGSAVSVYRDLQTMMNFSELVLGGDEIQVHSNGTIFGESADAFRSGEGDILISHHVLRPIAAQGLSFIQPTRLLAVFAYAKRPALKMRATLFLDTFAARLWICVLGTCLIIMLSMYAVIWIRRHRVKNSLIRNPRNDRDFLDTLSWMIGVICQQGRHVHSSVIPIQVISITAHLTMVILYCAYTAKLVSNLSVKIPQIQSFDDLVFYKFQFIIDEASVSMVEYARHLKLYYGDKLECNAKVVSSLDLIKTVMTSKSALLSYDDDAIRYYGWYSDVPQRFACDFMFGFSAEVGFPTRHGMVLPKGSEFLELFNYKTITLMERGFLHRYNKMYERQTRPLCLQDEIRRLEPTGIKEMIAALLVYIVGFTASAICMAFERVVFYYRPQSILVN